MRVQPIVEFGRRLRGVVNRLRAGLPRCHWFTWSLTLLVALALALNVVPGDYVDWRFREPATRWEQHCQNFYAATLKRHEPTMRDLPAWKPACTSIRARLASAVSRRR